MDRKSKYLIGGFFVLILLSLSASYWKFVVQHDYIVTYEGEQQTMTEDTVPALCEGLEPSQWLFFGPNIPTVVHYTHLIPVFFSLLIVIFILFQKKRDLAQYILLTMVGAFIVWVLADMVYWANNRTDFIMLAWVVSIVTETLIYMGGLYLAYMLIDKADTFTSHKKLLALALCLPAVVFLPTTLTLSGFDIATCLADEGFIALYYMYFVEILITLWILVLATARHQQATDIEKKKEIISVSAGILFLLVAFASNNIIGSATGNWDGYGLFGMPVFAGILFYSIVRFKTFGIKILTTVALIVTLMIILFLNIFV